MPDYFSVGMFSGLSCILQIKYRTLKIIQAPVQLPGEIAVFHSRARAMAFLDKTLQHVHSLLNGPCVT